MTLISRDGIKTSTNKVEIGEHTELQESYVVRLIGHDGLRKIVIEEEPFNTEPNDGQIMYCLAKHPTADFAVVEKIYKLDKNDLPFS